jgi:hypothetical protein
MLDANDSSDLIKEFGRRHRSDESFLKGNLSGTIDGRGRHRIIPPNRHLRRGSAA